MLASEARAATAAAIMNNYGSSMIDFSMSKVLETIKEATEKCYFHAAIGVSTNCEPNALEKHPVNVWNAAELTEKLKALGYNAKYDKARHNIYVDWVKK